MSTGSNMISLRPPPIRVRLIFTGEIYAPKVEQVEPLEEECRHFIDCIENKKEPATNGREGLKIVKLLEAAQEALESNGRVLL